jgi:hypothetical protein
MKMTRKKTIMRVINDLVNDFTYYDRKEDDSLPRGAIQEAVSSGEITVAEIVGRFEKKLRETLNES